MLRAVWRYFELWPMRFAPFSRGDDPRVEGDPTSVYDDLANLTALLDRVNAELGDDPDRRIEIADLATARHLAATPGKGGVTPRQAAVALAAFALLNGSAD